MGSRTGVQNAPGHLDPLISGPFLSISLLGGDLEAHWMAEARRKLQVNWIKDVERRPVDWLWKGWIPRGTVTLFTGDPGAGKSTIILELAARLTRGEPLPGEAPHDRHMPERVWIMSSEDEAGSVIRWRFENQGGDPAHLLVTDKRTTIEGSIFREMAEIIRENGITLVVIDTTTTWMGGDLDMNRANEAMGWIDKLNAICKDTGVTIMLVRHRRKGGPGDNKLHSGLGTVGFTAAARSELMAYVNRKKGMRILEKTKGNVGRPPISLAYRIDPHPDPENPHGILVWEGGDWSDEEMSEIMGLPAPRKVSRTPKTLGRAREWLAARLASGPVLASTLFAEAAQHKITESTLKRARQGIAETREIEKGVWVWSLLAS